MTDPNINFITTVEALVRLGQHAPSRSALYQAVSAGKVAKAQADENSGKGPLLVSWASVQEWNHTRLKRGGKCKQVPRPVESKRGAVNAENATAADKPQPATSSESPTAAKTVNGTADSTKDTAAVQATTSAVRNQPTAMPGKNESKTVERRQNSRRRGKPAAPNAKAPSNRRTIPLRKIKNMLRHFPTEQLIDLRDWLTKRQLLRQLRSEITATTPIMPATSDNVTK